MESREKGERNTAFKLQAQGLSRTTGPTAYSKSSVTLEVKESLGVLWPVKVWAEHHPDDATPTKDRLTSVKHKGALVTGILKPKKYGFEQGCLELNARSTDGCELVEEAAAATPQQAEAAMAALTKAKSIGVSSKNDVMKLTCSAAKAPVDSDSEEEGLMSRLRKNSLVVGTRMSAKSQAAAPYAVQDVEDEEEKGLAPASRKRGAGGSVRV